MKNNEIILKRNNKIVYIDTEKEICITIGENEFDYDVLKSKVKKMKKKEMKLQFQYGAVYLFVTRRCNMNCRFCAMNANKNVQKEKEMTINDIKNKILPFLKLVNPRKIIVTGGEPLIRNDIVEILKILKEELDCIIIVQSNGTLVNDNILEMIKGTVDELDYSIGHMLDDKLYLMENIKQTKDKVTENVVLSYVYTGNVKELLSAFDVAKELKIELLVTPVTPIGRGKNVRIDSINQLDLYINMAIYILENNLEDSLLVNNLFTSIHFMKSCGGLGRELAIYPEGDVHMCKCIDDKVDYIGNVFLDDKNDILECWKMNTEKEKIKQLFHIEYKKICRDCEYKYLCGGMCGAELLQNNNESDCYIRKQILEFMLFNYEKNLPMRVNIMNFVRFLNEKKEKVQREADGLN